MVEAARPPGLDVPKSRSEGGKDNLSRGVDCRREVGSLQDLNKRRRIEEDGPRGKQRRR